MLQVSAYFKPHAGGSEWYCHELSRHLAKKGHEVHVITSRLYKDTAKDETTNGFEVHRYPCLGTVWGVNPLTLILHSLSKWKADVIHVHSYIFFTSNQAVLMAKLSGVPVLLHLHGGITSIPPATDLLTRIRFHLKNAFYDATLGKWTVRAAHAVASVSKQDIERAKKLWMLSDDDLHWVPNAIDLDRFSGHDSDRQLNVVFIGRLEPWKGIQTLLDVARIVGKERRDVNFIIVGDGSLMRYVRNNSSSFNDHIRVLGQVPHTMIPSLLSETTVLVLPSYVEGLPTVCLEALAAGVPMVASNVGGVPEVVLDGETGYLFPPGDTRVCSKRILELLSDETLRKGMGKRGRDLARQVYTWDNVVEKVEKIYDKISG